jgi:hypothetical protein
MKPKNKQRIENLVNGLGAKEAIKRLAGVSSTGSTPASCSRTREAGRKHDATTDHTTAPPFPDQGWGGVQRLVEKLKERAAKFRNKEHVGAVKAVTIEDAYEMAAAEIDRAARKLTTALRTESLTQSVAEDVQDRTVEIPKTDTSHDTEFMGV